MNGASPIATRSVARVGATAQFVPDDVVVEEPLEIRVAGDTLAITMRTPGADRELVLGFLFAEGIIASLDDVSALAHCGRTADEARGNTVEVTPAPGARLHLPEEAPARRGTLTTSACGVCGRRSVDDLLARCKRVHPTRMAREAITRAVTALRARQPYFSKSGGCHGAGLFTTAGDCVSVFEDVGRHNAVDKLIGSRLLLGALPARDQALVVSGRTSFEIVQKAVAAGVSIVIGISAPSSLAIDVAARAGVLLVGFARGHEFVVYAGADRVD
jgi:FdhD protein